MHEKDQMMAIANPELLITEYMQSYGQNVWNYAFLLTRSTHAADDITQEVFEQAFLHLSKFEHRSSPKTWLLSITRNRSKNHMTSAFMRRVTLMDRIDFRETEGSAEGAALDRYSVNVIWKHVLSLPAKYREALLLDAHYQLSHREIAQLLGIAEGTVKSRIHRARAKMEKLLKGDELGNEQIQ